MLQAQRPTPPSSGARDDRAADVARDTSRSGREFFDNILQAPDTLEIEYYHAHYPEAFTPYPDSMLGNDFQKPDPTRKQLVDHAYLGSLGNPAKSILFEVDERTGTQIGFRQFSLYQTPLDSIRFYKINRTYSETSYEQGNTKNDFIFGATFARNLTDRMSISMDYTRIAHTGFFQRQRSRHTDWSVSLAMKHKKERYKSFLTYHYLDVRQEDNGGITSDSLYADPLYNDRTNLPVLLDNAFTRNLNQTVSYTQYYDLLPSGKDSTDTSSKRHLTLGHQLSFSAGDYKFYDNIVQDIAESYYDTLNTDSRGLRHYISWRRLENEFSVSTYKTKGKEKQPRDLFRVGLIQSYDRINQEPRDTNLNNLFVFGEWKYRPAKFLALDVYAKYGIGNAGNDYLIRGNLKLGLGKVGQLNAKILNQRYSTDILHQNLYISKRQVYQNNFVKPITTSIGASYHLPVAKTTLSANYHLINNYIYYDTLSIARQVSGALNVLQFVVQQDFRFGIFGMENTVALQYANDDYIRIPLLAMKNSTFIEGQVFKKVMLARLGLDFRMNTSYFADAYQSATGQFHLQDDQRISAFPGLDLFLSFKVETFRFYARMENMTRWISKDVYYLTPDHPMPDAHFRFGISWRFID